MPELGLSHLTVIRTHKNLDHLLSSVESIIKLKRDVVNNFFRTAGVAKLVKLRSLGSNLRYCSSDTTTFCSRIEFFGSQLSICDRKLTTCATTRVGQFTGRINPPRMLHPKPVRQLAIIGRVVNYKVRALPFLDRA